MGTDASTPESTGRARTGGVRGIVGRHQTVTFFGLTLLLTWVAWGVAYVATDGSLSQAHLIPGAFGPMVAAALVTRICGDSVRAWAARIVDWRVRPRWYLLALGVPLLVTVGGAGAVLAVAGISPDPSILVRRLPMYPVAFGFILLVGGGQEEPGWRGFALPRLQRTYGALTSSLIVGAVWAIWHLPLFVAGLPRNASGNFLLYAVLVIGLSVLLTWCYNSTGGSVLLAMLFHAGVNTASGLVPLDEAAIDGSALLVDAGMILGVWVAAIAVVVWRGAGTLSADGLPGDEHGDGTGARDPVEPDPAVPDPTETADTDGPPRS